VTQLKENNKPVTSLFQFSCFEVLRGLSLLSHKWQLCQLLQSKVP
jgi:hypothetical protein